jgi:hypothetical protein
MDGGDPRMNPLLIGMNNPYGTDPHYALYPLPEGSAGGRLYEMIHEATGLSRSQYVRSFDRINLVEGPWSPSKARSRVIDLRPSLAGRVVVMLGREVQLAFEVVVPIMEEAQLFEVGPALARGSPGGLITYYAIPHPSGRNPWYNDPQNRCRVVALLRRIHEEAGGATGEAPSTNEMNNEI